LLLLFSDSIPSLKTIINKNNRDTAAAEISENYGSFLAKTLRTFTDKY
jgi:hypothetical protein